jgi:hypothetical protein
MGCPHPELEVGIHHPEMAAYLQAKDYPLPVLEVGIHHPEMAAYLQAMGYLLPVLEVGIHRPEMEAYLQAMDCPLPELEDCNHRPVLEELRLTTEIHHLGLAVHHHQAPLEQVVLLELAVYHPTMDSHLPELEVCNHRPAVGY